MSHLHGAYRGNSLSDYWSSLSSNSKINIALEEEVIHLRHDLAKMSILCQAMWHLLSEKAGVTDADLLARMQTLQGQIESQDTCSHCGRRLLKNNPRCIYCGQLSEATVLPGT
jgi:hypothetical protein